MKKEDVRCDNNARMLAKMCSAHLLESSGHGRGTKYHIYGVNVALPKNNLLDGKNNLLDGKNNLSHKKNYKREELRILIIEFCQDWKTADDIAAYLGRDIKYIINKILPQMGDIIEKMYEVPHHPRQKYRAKQK